MTTNTQPLNDNQLNQAQSAEANQAMDGISPTDINQDDLVKQNQVATDDSYLEMMVEAKKPE